MYISHKPSLSLGSPARETTEKKEGDACQKGHQNEKTKEKEEEKRKNVRISEATGTQHAKRHSRVVSRRVAQARLVRRGAARGGDVVGEAGLLLVAVSAKGSFHRSVTCLAFCDSGIEGQRTNGAMVGHPSLVLVEVG
jgi:hypothetical protein